MYHKSRIESLTVTAGGCDLIRTIHTLASLSKFGDSAGAARRLCTLSAARRLYCKKRRPGFFFSYLKVCLSSELRERVVQGPSPSLPPPHIPTLVPPGLCRNNITRRHQAHGRSLPSTFWTTTPPEIETWTQRLSPRMWCRCWGRRAC